MDSPKFMREYRQLRSNLCLEYERFGHLHPRTELIAYEGPFRGTLHSMALVTSLLYILRHRSPLAEGDIIRCLREGILLLSEPLLLLQIGLHVCFVGYRLRTVSSHADRYDLAAEGKWCTVMRLELFRGMITAGHHA